MAESPKLDKAALFAVTDFETAEHTIGGFGAVTIRQLSRLEMQRIHKLYQTAGVAQAEQDMVSTACVDPTFTAAEVRKWQSGPLGQAIGDLVEAINDLSGVGGDAGPAATEQFPD